MRDEGGRLAAVEVIGHPRREERLVAEQIFSGHGSQIERLQRLVKLQTRRADGLKLRDLLRRQRPGLG